MTWGVILVMCYVETGCRVVSVGRDYDTKQECTYRAKFAEFNHRGADYLSVKCGLQRDA